MEGGNRERRERKGEWKEEMGKRGRRERKGKWKEEMERREYLSLLFSIERLLRLISLPVVRGSSLIQLLFNIICRNWEQSPISLGMDMILL